MDIEQNSYKGRRAFLIASGPSLKKENLETLRNEITIGVNESYKALLFQPNFLCIGDRFLWPFVKKVYARMEQSKLFLSTGMDGSVGRDYEGSNLIGWAHLNRKKSITEYGIHWDLENKPLHIGYGVVPEVAIPFACYCGFSELYLLGCDCSQNGYAFADPIRGVETQRVLEKSLLSYEKISKQKLPTKIVNISQGSLLDCFPKTTLTEVLKCS